MESNDEEIILDRSYLTIVDFLNDRFERSDDINHNRTTNDIEFHFNKPGFDLALVITHTSLIQTIKEIQIPLQSKHGFTTHVIYLPDVSKLKFCIRDLKLHEILYALIVSENSKVNDEYDVFILSEIIEHQINMPYEEAITLICADWTNYSEQLKRLMYTPERSPHADNSYTEGFKAPTRDIRYLLCLLADYRLLELDELLVLKNFLKSRRDAIIKMRGRPINYGLNDRPIPAYQQDKFKYYIYEQKSNSIVVNEVNPQIQDASKLVTKTNGNLTKLKRNQIISNNVQMENTKTSTSSNNVTIEVPPKLYINANHSKKISNSTTSQTLGSPTPVQFDIKSNSQAIKNLFLKSTKSNDEKNNSQIGNNKIQISTFAVSKIAEPIPIARDVNKSNEKSNATKTKSISNVNVQNYQKVREESNNIAASTHNKVSQITVSGLSSEFPVILIKEEVRDIGDSQSIVYHLSPVSSVASEKSNCEDKTRPSSSPVDNQNSNNGSPHPINLAAVYSMTKSKITKISSNLFFNLFKFVLNVSPLSLPSHSDVLTLLKTCFVDMEKYVISCGLSKIVVDMRACRSGGYQEILKIIETLCEETLSNRYNTLSDIRYMWMYFPRNLSPDNVNIVFYKVMKMLELTKSGKRSVEILMTMIQKLSDVVYYDFNVSDVNSFNTLNCFPSMFKEFFGFRTELHSLCTGLPPPEPASASLKAALDRTFLENKIKFVVVPLMEYFLKAINSVHYQLDIQTMEDIFVAFRTLRFCLRKICNRLLPDHLSQFVPFSVNDDIMARTMELLDEINFIIREVGLMNCILFTKKHYDFVNLILDFTIKIDKSVTEGTEADMCPMDLECLIDVDANQFINDFSSNIKAAVFPYHHDTEIEFLQRSLKNRWIDILHQAFKGIPPEPDGSRMSKEILYMLPKGWGKHTFDEAVTEAASLSYVDWECMLENDFTTARMIYADVRNNYLMWLSNNSLDHKKAMELMTASQKRLDAKILMN